MLNPDRCWQAVCERDQRYTDAFVFAVSSTGIFCRPDCPARRPKRSNVSFYADAASAQAAGYRPCQRCSPHGQSPGVLLDQLVDSACHLLTHEEQSMTLPQLAGRIGLSPSHLARTFKQRTGLTPFAWRKAQQQTHQGASATPAHKEHLRFAISPCPLGQLLMAASPNGACALLLGDDEAALLEELQQRFAKATWQRDQAGLHAWLEQACRLISEPTSTPLLPLDIRGTAFQQRVWQALQQIPSGQTRTYSELAAELGSHPRAIARACASNPLGLLIPCHRVVASDGRLSGYRWGIARKQALLEHERLHTEAHSNP